MIDSNWKSNTARAIGHATAQSEVDLHCELSNSGVVRRQNISEACSAKRVPKRTCGVAWRREIARSNEVRPIEYVEELGAELDSYMFAGHEILIKSRIRIEHSWSPECPFA